MGRTMGTPTTSGLKRDGRLKLTPKYTEQHWNEAFDGGDKWDSAIDIAEDRIKGRWLDAADRLSDEPNAGFATLALDCIVLESLWGFMHGKATPPRQERQVYQDILTGPRFGLTTDLAESFRDQVRNGIMHDAETRKRWLIAKTVPRHAIIHVNKNGDYVVNRTNFHAALKSTFADWTAKLRAGDRDLRHNMRKRMNGIITKHYG